MRSDLAETDPRDPGDALASLTRTLDALGIPHALVGAMAAAVWGDPRRVAEIEVAAWVAEADVARVLAGLLDSRDWRVLTLDPTGFIRDTRVLPLRGPGRARVNLVFGMTNVEERAIHRAVRRRVAGADFPVCAPEDAILHLLVSMRGDSTRAIEGILRRHYGILDFRYLEPHVEEFAREIHPDLALCWEELMAPYRRA